MNVHDFLNNQISELQSVKEYIADLENKLSDQSALNSVGFFTTVVPDVSVQKLYKPVLSYVEKEKCGKCDKDRFIKTDNDFYNEYVLCECAIDTPVFKVEEINVAEIRYDKCSENCIFIYYDASGNQISFSEKYVKKIFNELDDWKTSYYETLEECDKMCNFLNGGDCVDE